MDMPTFPPANLDALTAFDTPAICILAVARGPACTAEKLIDVFRQLDATH